ncbi:MAG: hypothetical protein V4659_03930 [Pseudomonadota bacterium]
MTAPRHILDRINAITGVDRAGDGKDSIPLSGQMRLRAEAAALAEMRAIATPPPDMAAAPVAPARGPMSLQPLFDLRPGGTRIRVGAHFRSVCALEAMVAHARARHADKGGDAPFVAPFTPGQIAMAHDYRQIVEWRAGSPLRCASLEAGRGGGGGSGLFIDTYIEQGRWLDELRGRIGAGVAMDVRRNMDRGNGRRPIKVRTAVDLLILGDRDLSAILRRHGWEADGKNRKALRLVICAALDRMQGYRGGDAVQDA